MFLNGVFTLCSSYIDSLKYQIPTELGKKIGQKRFLFFQLSAVLALWHFSSLTSAWVWVTGLCHTPPSYLS